MYTVILLIYVENKFRGLNGNLGFKDYVNKWKSFHHSISTISVIRCCTLNEYLISWMI